MKEDQKIKHLLKTAQLELSNKNFEDIVMRKVEFSYQLRLIRRKNIKISWICLLASAILFPFVLLVFSRISTFGIFRNLGISLESIGSILMPASVLITAIIILLQIDNLLRLTFQPR